MLDLNFLIFLICGHFLEKRDRRAGQEWGQKWGQEWGQERGQERGGNAVVVVEELVVEAGFSFRRIARNQAIK